MVSERKLTRLANRSHGFGRRARKAVAKLQEAAVAGDLAAAQALGDTGRVFWLDQVWLAITRDEPAVRRHLASKPRYEEDWIANERAISFLALDPDPQALTAHMRVGVVAAAALDHPIGAVARAKLQAHPEPELVAELCLLAEQHDRLAGFCADHGFIPTDQVAGARFLLLTGRFGEYRATDPSGALLREAYAAASEHEQQRLRDAVLRHGASDLLHTLIGENQSARIDELYAGELDRLARALAERKDWPRLWDLVTAASVVEAVELGRLIDPHWQPPTQLGQHLFSALRGADTDTLRSAYAAPTLLAEFEIGPVAAALAVAPDQGQVAAAWHGSGQTLRPQRTHIGLYDVARQAFIIRELHDDDALAGHLAHLGDGVVLHADSRHGLVRYTTGDRTVLEAAPVLQLSAAAGRYVACTHEELLLGERDTGRIRRVPLSAVGLPGPDRETPGRRVYGCAAVDGERFVIGVGETFAVVDAAGDLLASGTCDQRQIPDDITFTSPDELVTNHWHGGGRLQRWRIEGNRVVRLADPVASWVYGLAGLPGEGRLVVRSNAVGSRFVVDLLDGAALDAEPDLDATPRSLHGKTARVVAPAGAHSFALAGRRLDQVDVVELHDLRRYPVLRLLGRPVATLRPADLAAVATFEAQADDPVVALLRACLEHRFGADVTLGTHPVVPGVDDIQLGNSA